MKLHFRDVDEIGIRYMELGEPMGAARAINLVVMEGESCSACGGGPSTEKSKPDIKRPVQSRDAHWHRVCADCDAPWAPGPRVAVLRSEVEIPTRRDSVEALLVQHADEWAVIRRLVEDRPHRLRVDRRTLTLAQSAWDFAVISWLTYLRANVGSVARVVEVGILHRPQFGAWWRPSKVRRAIVTAQGVVEARARRERLLAVRCAG